ncbi:hydrolase [Methylotetracoccus oryzae]|uniref:hydrolase n=1 Tax=Methylotetracoccus oryzae TaxID=1919059 RepID=UPI001914AF1D|nr:hydrolase [Methylotetracoccus oryzae]
MPIDWSPAFRPARWLQGAHRQTIWPALFRRIPPFRRQRERLVTPDGDFLHLDWFGTGTGPLILLLHGLSGSSESGYVRGLQVRLAQCGFRTVAMNFRGCSGVMNDTARCYHSGETTDLDFVIGILRSRERDTPIGAVGFSLGGNVLLKWLGEQGDQAALFGAVAVSVPLRLDLCATRMDQGASRLYRDRLLRELKDYLSVKRAHLQRIGRADEARSIEALGDWRAIRSFWEYDQQVVAGLYGFRDAADYYERSSARQYLRGVRVPTLVIQALDDPFMTPAVLPEADELSHSVLIEVTRAGGHVGFVEGPGPAQPRYWLDGRIPDFFDEQLASLRHAAARPDR